MKKFLILFFGAITLWACNNAESNKRGKDTASNTAHQHNNEQASLTLNHGEKWKSDESTNKNVEELKVTVSRFNENKNKSLADFHAAAGELQTGLDKMIKECRMQGADHDALHLWLEPVLKNVNSLKTVTSEAEASKLFSEIGARINSYKQYFE
jgi:phage-related tail protein